MTSPDGPRPLTIEDYRALLWPLLDRMVWARSARTDPKVSARVFAANMTGFPWEQYERDIRGLLDAARSASHDAWESVVDGPLGSRNPPQRAARSASHDDDPLYRAEVVTHDPSKYTLHNSEDGTVWQMDAARGWVRSASHDDDLDDDRLDRAIVNMRLNHDIDHADIKAVLREYERLSR